MTILTASKKTTISGIAAFVAALGTCIYQATDGDLATVPDWNIPVTAFIVMIGLWNARDNNVTSSQAGAK